MIESLKDGSVADAPLLVDELFAALAAYFVFTRDLTLSLGPKLSIRGGVYAGATYADTDFTLTASTTTYIEADLTVHTIGSNTSAYTSGKMAIGVAVTNADGLLSWRQDFTVARAVTP